jgi:hypothetical protein
MDPAYVLLIVVVALIAIAAKAISDVNKKCNKASEGLIAVATKLDILLELGGLDIHKVNKAIKEHMDELKKNDRPSIGCINVKELYRAYNDGQKGKKEV